MIQIFASNTKPISEKLIEYNSNDLKENEEERGEEEKKEPIYIELTYQKAGLDNDENAIDFRLSNVQGED